MTDQRTLSRRAVVRLVLRRGPAREVRRLGWAELAFGAVGPMGGAGGLAVGAWAMRAWGISWPRIARRSAVIFLLTSGVNALVLALAGFGIWLGVGSRHSGLVYGLVPGLVGTAAIVFFLVLPPLAAARPPGFRGPRLGGALQSTAGWVSDSMTVLREGDWRLLGAIGYLLFDIAALWGCAKAVGLSPPLLALVAGYQIGYLANLVPIPGAIGVLDGGLLGALVLYGLPVDPSVAAVVLYHAIALWVPVVGGTIGFTALRGTLTRARAKGSEVPAAGSAATATPAAAAAASAPPDSAAAAA